MLTVKLHIKRLASCAHFSHCQFLSQRIERIVSHDRRGWHKTREDKSQSCTTLVAGWSQLISPDLPSNFRTPLGQWQFNHPKSLQRRLNTRTISVEIMLTEQGIVVIFCIDLLTNFYEDHITRWVDCLWTGWSDSFWPHRKFILQKAESSGTIDYGRVGQFHCRFKKKVNIWEKQSVFNLFEYSSKIFIQSILKKTYSLLKHPHHFSNNFPKLKVRHIVEDIICQPNLASLRSLERPWVHW